MRTWTEEYKSYSLENLPYVGQLYGSWGYELINRIEPNVPINPLEENEIPYGSWMFFDQLVIFDQMKRCITVVVYADTSSTSETHVQEIYQDSISRINRIKDLILGYFFAEDFNKVVELSFDIRVMDTRSLALILYSRSKLNQDIKVSSEYQSFKVEFKDTDWEQTIDRFHIQDEEIIKNLVVFMNTI